MDKFSALADPTRRSIIELLADQGPLSASEISERYSVSPSAISQHLKILREANLVSMKKQAQQRIYMINTQTVKEVEGWANRMAGEWNTRFDVLEKLLEAEKRNLY